MLASNSKYSKFWKVIEGTENHSKNHNYNHLDKWLKNTKGQVGGSASLQCVAIDLWGWDWPCIEEEAQQWGRGLHLQQDVKQFSCHNPAHLEMCLPLTSGLAQLYHL